MQIHKYLSECLISPPQYDEGLLLSAGNFEFGIARVMKALQPCTTKLNMNTWFYAKRCLLALMDAVAKQLVVLPVGLL